MATVQPSELAEISGTHLAPESKAQPEQLEPGLPLVDQQTLDRRFEALLSRSTPIVPTTILR